MISFKQICSRCKKNYVLATSRDRYPICFECQKGEMLGEITDPKMKKFFDIPEDFYKQNMFLRNIKINYLRYGRLSEPQIEAFNKTVEKMNEPKKPVKSK
jgi:hypothetical protein